MKKLICIVLVCAYTMVVSAQIQVGVKAGVNLADLNITGIQPNSSISYSSRVDFNAGILVSIPLFKSFQLQPELVYSGQGANSVIAVTSLTASYNYLNIPVLFKYQHGSGLFAETGPQIGFLMNASEKGGNQGSVNIKSIVQSTDFSWALGLGYKFEKINFGIDARYNLGLTNTQAGQYSNGVTKNSVFQFGLFYMFKSH